MIKQNFKAIGRIPGGCIFVHLDNVPLLNKYGYSSKIHCIGIDFNTGQHSDPVIIGILLKFVPHDMICSEGEREVISDLVAETLNEGQIKEINKLFEEIKYQE